MNTANNLRDNYFNRDVKVYLNSFLASNINYIKGNFQEETEEYIMLRDVEFFAYGSGTHQKSRIMHIDKSKLLAILLDEDQFPNNQA